MDPIEFCISDLPASMRLMAEVIGMGKALQIIRGFGGSRIYFPERGLRSDHPVREVLTNDECIRLSKYFLGTMNVPRAKSAMVVARDRQIWQDNESGQTLRQLSVKYDVCERQISISIENHERRLQNLSNSLKVL